MPFVKEKSRRLSSIVFNLLLASQQMAVKHNGKLQELKTEVSNDNVALYQLYGCLFSASMEAVLAQKNLKMGINLTRIEKSVSP